MLTACHIRALHCTTSTWVECKSLSHCLLSPCFIRKKVMQSALPRYCAEQQQMRAETTVRRWQLELDGVLGCELSRHRKTVQRPRIRELQFRRRTLNSYFYCVLLLSKISTFFRISGLYIWHRMYTWLIPTTLFSTHL